MWYCVSLLFKKELIVTLGEIFNLNSSPGSCLSYGIFISEVSVPYYAHKGRTPSFKKYYQNIVNNLFQMITDFVNCHIYLPLNTS